MTNLSKQGFLFQNFRFTKWENEKLKIKKNNKSILKSSVAEPEPVEPKLFGDLEPEAKINLNKHFLQSVWKMLGRRKANFYLY